MNIISKLLNKLDKSTQDLGKHIMADKNIGSPYYP